MWSRRRARHSPAIRLAAASLLAAGIVAVAGSPAWAHANLLGTSPTSGARLDEPPAEVRLRFSERVTVAPDGVELRGADGEVVETAPATVEPDNPTTVVVPMPPGLGDGSYVVSFRVVSADSHPLAGAVTFGIGTSAAPVDELGRLREDPVVPVVFAVSRWTGYTGLALLAGGLVGLALWWPDGWRHPRARRLVATGWSVSVAGAGAALLLQGPYSAGRSMAGIADPALLSTTLDTDYGRYMLARLGILAAAGVVVLGGGRWYRRPTWRRPGAVTLGAVTVAVALPATWVGTGHANTAGTPWDVAADIAHLVAMASWFGGLALLAVCLLPRAVTLPAGEVAGALRRFSLLATVAVATLVSTGLYVAWRRVGTLDALFGTPYGRLLAFKLAAMGVLLWLGALSRSVVQRRYARPADAAFGPVAAGASRSGRRAARSALAAERGIRAQLRQSVRLEAGLAVTVLALASVLVATPPGVVVTAAAAQAGEPTGPVYETVELAGQDVLVQVLVDPGWVGENDVVVTVTDAAATPLEVPDVTASFSLSDPELGPLPVELSRTGPGTYQALRTRLPAAGGWQLRLGVRTSRIDITTVRVDVPVS